MSAVSLLRKRGLLLNGLKFLLLFGPVVFIGRGGERGGERAGDRLYSVCITFCSQLSLEYVVIFWGDSQASRAIAHWAPTFCSDCTSRWYMALQRRSLAPIVNRFASKYLFFKFIWSYVHVWLSLHFIIELCDWNTRASLFWGEQFWYTLLTPACDRSIVGIDQSWTNFRCISWSFRFCKLICFFILMIATLCNPFITFSFWSITSSYYLIFSSSCLLRSSSSSIRFFCSW